MSVFDRIFGNSQPTPPAPAPTPSPAQNASTPNNPAVDPNNPMVPAGTADAPQDPFKDFQGIWDIDTTKLNPDTPFFAGIDPKAVMEVARKVNFNTMTQEQMTAIAAGGPEAVKAMQAVLGNATQNVYGQSALATSQMIDKALAAQRKQIMDSLPSLITKQQVNTGLQETNPLFTNPTLAPMVEAIGEKFLAKNPNASSADIQKQVASFFDTMGVQFAPKAAPVPNARKEQDWDKFFE